MAKATGLIFSLLDVASAQEAPFWHTAVHTMYSAWNYVLEGGKDAFQGGF